MNDPVCGRPPNANRRVLDGEPAGFGSFPWQALIRVGKGNTGYWGKFRSPEEQFRLAVQSLHPLQKLKLAGS